MPPPSPAPPPGELIKPKSPGQWESPLERGGEWIQGQAQDMVASAFENAMRAIWDGALTLLKGAFTIADDFSKFPVSTETGPVSVLWPLMLWISGVLALGLFFWQLTVSVLRGGRGFMRVVTGPVQYGIALAVTVGAVTTFLVAADTITTVIMQYGLRSENFTDALTAGEKGTITLLDVHQDGIKAVVLGLVAFFGVLPAAVTYLFEMLFREAAIYVLVATVPISAAGLLAGSTAKWYWTTLRWMLAAIAMKPVLALTLALGVAISGGSQGLSGLLAGVGVLLISALCPYVLFRLFSFVDPNSDAGQAIREGFEKTGLPSGPGDVGLDGAGRGNAGGDGGGGAQEDATEDRFDSSMAGPGGDDDSGPDWTSQDSDDEQDQSGPHGPGGPGDPDGEPGKPTAANSGRVVAAPSSGGHDGDGDSPDDDDDPPGPPSPPSPPTPPGGGDGGPSGGGGAQSGGTAAEAEEAAVIA